MQEIDDFGIISLMYHRFEENKYPSTNIRINDFKKHIKKIEDENINFINPKDFMDNLYKKKNERKILLTIDDKISIATVYRTVKLFEEAGILVKHDFKAGKARYEINDDHNHLIDINSGEIVEFVDKDIEKLQNEVAKKLGYKLVDHKLELYGSKIKK